jgi:hypothetical protein
LIKTTIRNFGREVVLIKKPLKKGDKKPLLASPALMPFWEATSTGKVLSRKTVQRVTNLELQVEENKAKCATFTASITEKLGGNGMIPIGDDGEVAIPDDWNDPRYNQDFVEEYGRTVNDPGIREADQAFTPDYYDNTYLIWSLRCLVTAQKYNLEESLRDSETRTGYRWRQLTTIQYLTLVYTRLNFRRDIKHRWHLTS